MNSCQHSKTHSRTEPEAGADTLGVDEKAASWKELEEVADWAYQSVLAVHLCRLRPRTCFEGCLKSAPEGPGLALYLSRSEDVGER